VTGAQSSKNTWHKYNACKRNTYKRVDNYEDNDTLVIDNTSLDVGHIQENMPEGRRIVDLSFLLKELHRTFDNHARRID